MSTPTLDSLAEGLTDEQVDDVHLVIKAMQSPRVSAAEVAGLLGDLRRVAEMPADDSARQAWAARKQDVLDRITASELEGLSQ
jgi:hypothetical protein